jgi:hypothetical protein
MAAIVSQYQQVSKGVLDTPVVHVKEPSVKGNDLFVKSAGTALLIALAFFGAIVFGPKTVLVGITLGAGGYAGYNFLKNRGYELSWDACKHYWRWFTSIFRSSEAEQKTTTITKTKIKTNKGEG